MINSEIIIKYTNALYSTPPEYSPRYDEFRDMFSSGQIRSKEWIIQELKCTHGWYSGKKLIIAGAWYGTLGVLMKSHIPELDITMLDLDPRCEKFIHNIIYNDTSMHAVTADMYKYNYTEDIIVNTSCEHIPDIKQWLSLIPEKKTVVLQSNNYDEGIGHINCADSAEDFASQTGLQNISFCGELVMPMYTRYMIIGTT